MKLSEARALLRGQARLQPASLQPLAAKEPPKPVRAPKQPSRSKQKPAGKK